MVDAKAQTSSKLMGVNHFFASGCDVSEDLFILLQQSHATAWREQMCAGDIAGPFAYRYPQLKQWAATYNVRLIIGTMGLDWGHSMAVDKVAIMANSVQTQKWIDAWKATIQAIQPFAIDVINEPQDVPFATYRQFVIKCIDAWAQVKPDLVFIVEDCPFWTLKNLAANPIPRANVLYAYHRYYALDGNPNAIPWASQWEKDYWKGNFAVAKTGMANEFLNVVGIAAMQAKGLTVFFEEAGTKMDNPNSLVFMQDFYAFCRQYNLGVAEHALVPRNLFAAGMLDSKCKTLNALGLTWQSNMIKG